MERLTHKTRGGAGRLNAEVPPWKAMVRLAEYEDLGVTPEQIREIDRLYAEKCREVAELKKKQTPMKPIKDRTQNIRYTSAYSCPNCGGGFAGTGIADYCYHCGQRLDWEETG